MSFLDGICDMNGEGVMLRDPNAPYRGGRSADLLKVKRFYDDEATVIGIQTGTGRNEGRMGALCCKDSAGITFNVGSGFFDAMRDNPPRKGTIITYKYQEKTIAGKPRFPVFLRVCPTEWSGKGGIGAKAIARLLATRSGKGGIGAKAIARLLATKRTMTR